MRIIRWIAVVLVGLLIVTVAAGCGGDDGEERPAVTPQPEEQADDGDAALERRIERAKRRAERRAERVGKREPEPEPESEPEGADKFKGQHAQNYETAKTVCGAFPQRKVARDLDLGPGADPVEIAEAYAEGYRPEFQQAPFEGCLAGLR